MGEPSSSNINEELSYNIATVISKVTDVPLVKILEYNNKLTKKIKQVNKNLKGKLTLDKDEEINGVILSKGTDINYSKEMPDYIEIDFIW